MRALALMLIIMVALAATASAEVLWDQSDFDPWGMGFWNSESGAPPMGMTIHSVNDITVADGGWLVDSITLYYSALDPAWGDGIIDGYLHVFEKVGPLPIDGVDDPTASPLVPMSGALNGDHIVVTATGLNLHLDEGEYWIGITPIAPSGPFGPELYLSSSTFIGDATASYDVYGMPMPMWMNMAPGVDGAMLIEGDISSPAEEASWGLLKALY